MPDEKQGKSLPESVVNVAEIARRGWGACPFCGSSLTDLGGKTVEEYLLQESTAGGKKDDGDSGVRGKNLG